MSKNNTVVATMSGTVRVTMEIIDGPNGPEYIARGRRLGRMVYRRSFGSDFKECSKFVNRSAGQSLRQNRIRSFAQGYASCIDDIEQGLLA